MDPTEWNYVLGIDGSQGGIGRTKALGGRKASDDFATAVCRFRLCDYATQLCKVTRFNGLTAEQMSAVIHRDHDAFNFQLMVMDLGGGGLSIRDELRNATQDIGDGQKFSVTPIITADDEQMQGVGNQILCLFSRGDTMIKDTGQVLAGESVLVNKAHELLRGAFEAEPQRIQTPKPWSGWPNGVNSFDTPDKMREWLHAQPGLSPRESAQAEMDLALFQLIHVDRVLSADGQTPKVDKYGMYEFKSTSKKDSGYAVLYSYFASWMIRERHRIKEQTQKETDFVCVSEDA